ncbi:hypothetical protein I5U56_02045 [Stenotrophomonas maltophilia]|uniref:hypothetical protein n=1 Tax=Stenotrophomonas forensis TaxID=2871169 RepID=UPI0018D35D56|nr:hypothetical protein [Stenotrophomonas maltophilia]MBH1599469.1 hypothetical protein [Stenotrophomonas maltophilia]
MLFDKSDLQVQQAVIAADLLPELARLAGVGRSKQLLAPGSGHSAQQLAALRPRVQADGEVMPAPLLAVLPANGQVVLLGRHRLIAEPDPKAAGHDAPDVLYGVEPGELGSGLVACRSSALHACAPTKAKD